ncbi:MAG TPA: hypothetical protein VHI78_09135 [Bacteroidales bacterium]|jgi:hypothetical protein|nr:hypothetical protein [Bacteroidales bacterium]
MRNLTIIFYLSILSFDIYSQSTDTLKVVTQNSADKLLTSDGKLLLGGYGEVHYNQPLNAGIKNNGTLDVHRMVLLLGYNFSQNTQFISEIEFEHVSEVYVEQAFLQYRFKPFLNLRAGLMLIPMGIINEYHEPVTFNGVERPESDTRIVPTTWREIGVGITGILVPVSLKYQFYVVTGFNGYDGEARLNGRNGFRGARQRGAESYVITPNITGKIEYYGLKGLNIGLSGYFGKSQSTLYEGIDKDNRTAILKADSSVTGIAMAGLDARYSSTGLQLRGQIYYTAISNTDQYNKFTGKEGLSNDLGSAMLGYYLEAGYDILRFIPDSDKELILFGRYEKSNTHFSTIDSEINGSYNNDIITCGLTLKLAKGAVVKGDMQFIKSPDSPELNKVFNAGFGIMF